MKDMLEEIRDCLKGECIGEWSDRSFNEACIKLNNRLTTSSVFKMGVKAGKSSVIEGFKELMDLHDKGERDD